MSTTFEPIHTLNVIEDMLMATDARPPDDPATIDNSHLTLPAPTGFMLYEDQNTGLQSSIWGYDPLRNRFLIETGVLFGMQDAGLPTVDTAYIDSDAAQGTTSKLSSLIYLEEGKSYTFQHQGSGTLSLIINGTAISDFVGYQSTFGDLSYYGGGTVLIAESGGSNDYDTAPSNTFTPDHSGFYDLNVFHYTVAEPGDLQLDVQVNDSAPQPLDTEHFALYSSPQDLIDAGLMLEWHYRGEPYDLVDPIDDATGLIQSSWSDLALSQDGRGERPDQLQATIDSAGEPTSRVDADGALIGNVAPGIATQLSGLIELDAGTTYTFSGQGDDSARIVIGDDVVAEGRWCHDQGTFSGTFTPEASGYYLLNVYHHNAAGPGALTVTVQADDEVPQPLDSEHFALYRDTTDLDDRHIQLSELQDDGYYRVEATGLLYEHWNIIQSPVQTPFGLDTSGQGEDPARLQSVLDDAPLPSARYTVASAQLTEVANPSEDTATKLSGLIRLEGGDTYTFSVQSDDSALIAVDDEAVAGGRWGDAQGTFSGSFTPEEDGYYDLAIYHHNADGPGVLNVDVQVNDAAPQPLDSEHFALYRYVSDLPAAIIEPADTVGIDTFAPADPLLAA